MMAVMPHDDSEEHLDEPDTIDDFLNSLSGPSEQGPMEMIWILVTRKPRIQGPRGLAGCGPRMLLIASFIRIRLLKRKLPC